MSDELAPWQRQEMETDERWQIDGLGSAEWAMGKCAEAERTLVQLGRQYEAWKAQLDQWLADASAPAQRQLEFFQQHLEGYALQVREQTGAATLKLPSGKVSTRKSGQAVFVEDEQAVLAAAHDTLVPDAAGEMVPLIDLVTTRRVSVSLLRDHVQIVEREVPGSLVTLEDGTTTTLTELVVVTRTGAEVHGAGVRAETVTATVVPTPGPEQHQVLGS